MTRQNKCLSISTVKSPVEVVEEMKKEAANVSEEMTKLHARVQTQYFARVSVDMSALQQTNQSMQGLLLQEQDLNWWLISYVFVTTTWSNWGL